MRPVLSLLLIALFATHLTAETRMVLRNGDSLRGTVIKVEDGIVHFESDALGHLMIPASDVLIEESDATGYLSNLPLAETSEPVDIESDATTPPPEPGSPTETPPDSPEDAVKPLPPWKKTVEFGMTLQSGRRDKMDVSGRFSANRNVATDQYRIRARYLYGETNSEKSTNLLESSFRWRRDLSPRIFTQALTAYNSDEIKRINHDFSQGVGLGRKVYNLDNLSVTMGGGATARYRDENGDPPVWNYMVDAFQDVEYEINKIFRLTQDASVLIEPEDPDNYLLKLNAALIGRITEAVSMSMRYEYEYDNSLTGDNRLNQRIITSLGYLF